MKKLIPKLLTVLLLTCAMTACPESPAPPSQKPPDPVPKAELEKKIEVERRLREQTEARLEKQESTTSQWQGLALCAVAGAVILLVVGTALGAQARHDAAKP